MHWKCAELFTEGSCHPKHRVWGTFAAVNTWLTTVSYISELHLLTVAVVPKSPGFTPTLIASVLLSGRRQGTPTVCSCPSNSRISSILLLFLLSFFLLVDLPFLPLSGRWFQTCISMSIYLGWWYHLSHSFPWSHQYCKHLLAGAICIDLFLSWLICLFWCFFVLQAYIP